MLGIILLIWVGLQLNAPTWFFVVIGIMIFINTVQLCAKMYKAGKGEK